MAFVPVHERCTAKVSDSGGYHFARCDRRGVLTEEGKLWCRQHAPSSVAVRRAKQNAKWAARAKARDEANERSDQAYRRADHAMRACEALIAGLDRLCSIPDELQPAIDAAYIATGREPLPPKPKACRECFNDYTPKPETKDDGFCSDTCAKTYDAELMSGGVNNE